MLKLFLPITCSIRLHVAVLVVYQVLTLHQLPHTAVPMMLTCRQHVPPHQIQLQQTKTLPTTRTAVPVGGLQFLFGHWYSARSLVMLPTLASGDMGHGASCDILVGFLLMCGNMGNLLFACPTSRTYSPSTPHQQLDIRKILSC